MENLSLNDYKLTELEGLPPKFFTLNRKNFIENLKVKTTYNKNSILIIQGGDEVSRFDTDVVHYHFQQEANFYYLTGVREPKFYGIINFNKDPEEITLFYMLPDDPNTRIWMKIPTLEELEKQYQLPVKSFDEFYKFIKSFEGLEKIYLLSGVNSDSKSPFQSAKLDFPLSMRDYEKLLDYSTLIYEILSDTRTVKTSYEIDLLKYVNTISIEGHVEAIKHCNPEMNERDLENIFFNHLRKHYYTRIWAYPMICGCGLNSSTLHYNNNDKVLKDGDLALMDMGIRFGEYCSDITSTIPVNGKFTETQANIYNLVLKANRAVQEQLKPGVSWIDMHLLAEKVILEGLVDLNILRGGFETKSMVLDRVAFYFMPHGLGHFLGLDTHDVGGYLSFTPTRPTEKGLSSLRTARNMAVNNVITVEPGIYFIEFHLEKALNDPNVSKYFNKEEVRKYYNFGGVRIEDDVLITDTGCINLTASLPREIKDIENLMHHA